MRVAHRSRFLATLILAMAATRPAAADTLTLMWDPSVDTNVAGYLVYVGTQTGNYSQTFDVGNTTSFAYSGATAGQPYYFAVAAYFPGPLIGAPSQEVSGVSSSGVPTLQNPGTQSSTVGVPVALQLSGSDPQGQSVSYGASPLPPGLSIVPSTGFISGTPTVAGTYLVTASVTDGVLSDAETFSWTIVQAASSSGSGGVAGDSLAPTLQITLPTSSGSYTSDQSYVTIGGTASDNVGVLRVEWSTSQGASGIATGTDSWIAGVSLGSDYTTITVLARDGAGNVASQSIVVKTQSSSSRVHPGKGVGRLKKNNWN